VNTPVPAPADAEQKVKITELLKSIAKTLNFEVLDPENSLFVGSAPVIHGIILFFSSFSIAKIYFSSRFYRYSRFKTIYRLIGGSPVGSYFHKSADNNTAYPFSFANSNFSQKKE
jgi:hypothetical protein